LSVAFSAFVQGSVLITFFHGYSFIGTSKKLFEDPYGGEHASERFNRKGLDSWALESRSKEMTPSGDKTSSHSPPGEQRDPSA
jgi:hypothetical protein